MLNRSLSSSLRLGAVAVLLAGAVASGHAGGVSASVSVAGPVAGPVALSSAVYRTGGPVGVVSVGYGGRGGPHHYRGGGGWGWGLGVGLGAGLLLASPWYYPNYYPNYYYPGVVVTQPSTVVVETQPQPSTAAPQPSRPDPVIYPRNGQSAQQLEADRQECNRWATTQAGAMNDSTIFMRAVDACMDGRGYTTK